MAEVEFTWALDGYCARYGFLAQPEGLTMREAARVFQLDPQPPEAGTLNDYITAALRERNLDYFSFFLHHYETRLNGRVRRFLMRGGWNAMTRSGSWTTKWGVSSPCWIAFRAMTR